MVLPAPITRFNDIAAMALKCFIVFYRGDAEAQRIIEINFCSAKNSASVRLYGENHTAIGALMLGCGA
jgi:hypothetical protein